MNDASQNQSLEFIRPDWPAPSNVHAVFTTRPGGYSVLPPDSLNLSLNLGLHVGDDACRVQKNRQLLVQTLGLSSAPVYLNQVHKTHVLCADTPPEPAADESPPEADACWTKHTDRSIAIMTADCLPILFTSHCGSVVAGAHAGWRGLGNGIVQRTISALPVKPTELIAWLGPAIGPEHFEVGAEVKEFYIKKSKSFNPCFTPVPGTSDKYLADLFALARAILLEAGVESVYGGNFCTYSDSRRFFSHRRDAGNTGRMAALIWKTD